MARLSKQQLYDKALDKAIEQVYYRFGNGVQINIMDISKIYDDCRPAARQGIEALEAAMQTAIAKYRTN